MKYPHAIICLCFLFTAGSLMAQVTAKDYSKKKNYRTLTERISGQWKLFQIVDGEMKEKQSGQGNQSAQSGEPSSTNDVGSEDGNNGMMMIEFTEESRYRRNNSTSSLDSGNFVINEQKGSLQFESDNANPSSSEWYIRLQGDKLTLTPTEGQADKRYKYIYRRTKARSPR